MGIEHQEHCTPGRTTEGGEPANRTSLDGLGPADAVAGNPVVPAGFVRARPAGVPPDPTAVLVAQRRLGNRHVAELLARQAPPAYDRVGAVSPIQRVLEPEPDILRPRHGERALISMPGERLLYSAVFRHDREHPERAGDYELVYATDGATVDAPGGSTTKTIPGTAGNLSARNVSIFIPATWTGSPPVTVRLELRRRGSPAVLKSWTWTHNKGQAHPTSIDQVGGEDMIKPFAEPVFAYRLGPLPAGAYENMTLLEDFDFSGLACNVAPGDMQKPADYPTPAAVAAKFFGDIPSLMYNSSFVVDERNGIVDGHGHVIKLSWNNRKWALTKEATSKYDEIYVEFRQTYLAGPANAPIGRYIIRVTTGKDGINTVRKRRDPAFPPPTGSTPL